MLRKILWNSPLSFVIFSTPLEDCRPLNTVYMLNYPVQNAAKLQGIVSWLTHTCFLAMKETLRVEPSYMSMKQVSSYTFGFQKVVLLLCIFSCLLRIVSLTWR